jgi:hypothetical protein
MRLACSSVFPNQLDSFCCLVFALAHEFEFHFGDDFLSDLHRIPLFLSVEGLQQTLDIDNGKISEASLVQRIHDISNSISMNKCFHFSGNHNHDDSLRFSTHS